MQNNNRESTNTKVAFTKCRWCLVLLLLASSGCGMSSSDGKYGLSGKILVDGQPLQSGTISFVPQLDQERPASAMFRDGQYNIMAEKGLTPGTYVVKIFANATETSELSPEELMTHSSRNTDRPTPQQTIPAEYNTNSTQVIEVSAVGPNKFDFDIKSK